MVSPISSNGVATLIERVARLTHSIGYAEGLYPAQWAALRYFTEAPPTSRTAGALARFQGMSVGPVARTVRVLVAKGLLVRVANPANSRATLIAVTVGGQGFLKRDPRVAIAALVETIPGEQRIALATMLEVLIPSLYSQRGSLDATGNLTEEPPLACH